MTAGWWWDPFKLRADLEALGYDVAADTAALAGEGGSLTARRDRAGRAYLVVVDAGGRFRAEVTVAVDAPGGPAMVAGVPLRVVGETRRTTTVSGLLADPGQLGPIVAVLDRLASPPPPDASAIDTRPDDGA